MKKLTNNKELVNILSEMCGYNKGDTKIFLKNWKLLMATQMYNGTEMNVSGLPKLSFTLKTGTGTPIPGGGRSDKEWETLVPTLSVPPAWKALAKEGFENRRDNG